MRPPQKPTSSIKRWRILVIAFVVFLLVRRVWPSQSFELNQEVVISQGDTLYGIYDKYLTTRQARSMRLYTKTHSEDAVMLLQAGKYIYSGSYTPENFLQVLMDGPVVDYEDVKILEGRSIYDIDQYLADNHLADQGEYIAYVTDPESLQTIATKYDFVQEFFDTKPTPWIPVSLEGLLYPDTYRIDLSKNTVYQLVALQLRAFQDKVYTPYRSQISWFSQQLRESSYEFDLRWYNIVTLASILEKEERTNANKPTIAGIFLNRIQQGMRIDADITLCYGLEESYTSCTPSIIVQHLKDSNNLYNTRVHSGLTPGPIANPSQASFDALLGFVPTSYLYYLHSSSGQIYYGTSLEEHNANKVHL